METYCIYYSVQLTSLNKKGKSTDTVFSHAELLRNTPPSLDTSRTVERGDVCFSLYQKGRGTDTVLVQVQSSGLRINSFNISDLRKTLSSRKYLSPSRKRTATFSSRIKGRGTDPVIAVFTQCFQSWRYTTETESPSCQTTSPDEKSSNKGTCGAGEAPLLNLHYQIR